MLHSLFYLETALHISGGITPIIRNTNNCIYNNWYLSRRYCYLPLSWLSWNRFECAVGGIRHPQHTQTGSNSSTRAAGSSNGVTNTRCCRYSCLRSWWWVWYHPKHLEQFPDINKLCNVASCWLYIRTFCLFAFPIPCYSGSHSQHYKVQADTTLFADKLKTYSLRLWLYEITLPSAVLPPTPAESYEVDVNKHHSLHP
jgi:hypothetical protein